MKLIADVMTIQEPKVKELFDDLNFEMRLIIHRLYKFILK